MLNETNKKTNGELQENKDENPYGEKTEKRISNDLGERIHVVDDAITERINVALFTDEPQPSADT